jgi:hypothetical protein
MRLKRRNDMDRKQFYYIYIGIGLFYVVIKLIFVAAGLLHTGAIFHGLVPAVLMSAAGLIALSSLKSGGPKSGMQWILILLPLLLFVITPIFMYLKQRGEWLTEGRLPVMIVYEALAAFQFAYSFRKRSSSPG